MTGPAGSPADRHAALVADMAAVRVVLRLQPQQEADIALAAGLELSRARAALAGLLTQGEASRVVITLRKKSHTLWKALP